MLPGLGVERDAVERGAGIGCGIRVAEHDVAELDPPARPWGLCDGDGVGGVGDLGNEVEVLEDAGEQGRRGLQVKRHPHQAHERHE